mgnify:CR=1 FL=1
MMLFTNVTMLRTLSTEGRGALPFGIILSSFSECRERMLTFFSSISLMLSFVIIVLYFVFKSEYFLPFLFHFICKGKHFSSNMCIILLLYCIFSQP